MRQPSARRVRAELRDLIEVVLLPGLAAVLPWPVCFALFRVIARSKWLYRDATQRALEQATRRGWVKDPEEWSMRRRLVTLVDHADLYLARTRTDRWLRRHMDVEGTWIATPGAQALFTFHWGAGMWGLRHLRAAGLRGHMLVARLDPGHFAQRRLFYRYILLRTRTIQQALGFATLDPALDLRSVMRVLRAGEQLVAAIDVPSDQVAASLAVQIAGETAWMPRALLRAAVEQGIPVTVFLTGIDLRCGRRTLQIHPIGVRDDVQTLADDVFALLDAAIRQAPADWHFWSEAERVFRRSGPAV